MEFNDLLKEMDSRTMKINDVLHNYFFPLHNYLFPLTTRPPPRKTDPLCPVGMSTGPLYSRCTTLLPSRDSRGSKQTVSIKKNGCFCKAAQIDEFPKQIRPGQ
jgi:hypothetical protein